MVDQLSTAVVDGGELVHGAAAQEKAWRSVREVKSHGERGSSLVTPTRGLEPQEAMRPGS